MSMDRISTLSKVLTGRVPSNQDLALYERLARACGIKDDDPLWTAMVILGHYRTLYAEIPERIEKAAAAQTHAVHESLTAHIARERTAIASDLADGVEKLVDGALRDHTRLKLTLSLAFAIMMTLTLCTLFAAGVAWMTRTAADADAAHRYAWVDSDAGKAAQALVENGAISMLRMCGERRGTFSIDREGSATCTVRGRKVAVS